jgi:Cys-tRNA(Pro)/Cys-tRNA(Cys) deacylase
MAAKPPGARILDQRKIAYELVAFDPAIRDAVQVAVAAGHPPAAVYKTLVVEEDPPRGRPMLVMVPADRELDLKAVAAAAGVKRARMASHADAERQTGLKVGGISAVALSGRGFRVFIDAAALGLDTILVSAGQRGFDLSLRTADLLAVTAATALDGCTRTMTRSRG